MGRFFPLSSQDFLSKTTRGRERIFLRKIQPSYALARVPLKHIFDVTGPVHLAESITIQLRRSAYPYVHQLCSIFVIIVVTILYILMIATCSVSDLLILLPYYHIFIIQTVIRTVPERIRKEFFHLVFIQAYVAHIYILRFIIYVIHACLAVYRTLCHKNLLFPVPDRLLPHAGCRQDKKHFNFNIIQHNHCISLSLIFTLSQLPFICHSCISSAPV